MNNTQGLLFDTQFHKYIHLIEEKLPNKAQLNHKL